MFANMELPKAFSVRDEHEFLSFQHLMARLNPKVLVKQVATGVHVNGGASVFWGLVYLDDEPPGRLKVEQALREAGFDFAFNVLTDHSFLAGGADATVDDRKRTTRKSMDRPLQDWEL
jgi:hypothetical protein